MYIHVHNEKEKKTISVIRKEGGNEERERKGGRNGRTREEKKQAS